MVTYKELGKHVITIMNLTGKIVEDQEKYPQNEQTERERELYGFAVDLNYQAAMLLKIIRELNNV